MNADQMLVCPLCGVRYADPADAAWCASSHRRGWRYPVYSRLPTRAAPASETARRLGWVTVSWGVAWLVASLWLSPLLALACAVLAVAHLALVVRRARRRAAWLRRHRAGGGW